MMYMTKRLLRDLKLWLEGSLGFNWKDLGRTKELPFVSASAAFAKQINNVEELDFTKASLNHKWKGAGLAQTRAHGSSLPAAPVPVPKKEAYRLVR